MFKVLNNYVELVNGYRDGILSMMSEFENSLLVWYIFYKNGIKFFNFLKIVYKYLYVFLVK